MAERLKQDTFEEKAFQADKLSLIEFYSDSCVPCKMMSVVLAELEEAYPETLYVGKVNVAYETELVQKYGISSAPTLIFIKNREIVKKLTGIQKKADLEQIIQRI